MKPAPMPWILCRPGFSSWPCIFCVMTGLLTGSTAMALKLGLRFLMTSLTPVMVPPVPTPETRMSTLPSVSFQISSAVVWRWISGLAGFLNCCGMNELGIVLQQLLGLGDGAVHALVAGRQHDLGAEGLEQPAAFQAHGLGHGDDELVAAGGAGEGQADAGVAAGRLDDGRVLVDLAVALGGVDHGHADAVLDRPERIEALQLGDDGGLGVADHAAQPDQRRVADGLGDVVVDPAAERLRTWGNPLTWGIVLSPFSGRRGVHCRVPSRGPLAAYVVIRRQRAIAG